jgi:hypothetical protein
METVLYRKSKENAPTEALRARSASDKSMAGVFAAVRDTGPLSPELFYPVVTAQEMITWTHWLPTAIVFDRAPLQSPVELLSTLKRLQAPPEVVKEFQWAWKLDLFEEYEVRTPVRRDPRDPLLLGRMGGQWYRIALWGESLLPLERITALVEQSLAIRARAARGRLQWITGGTLVGLAVGLWLGHITPESQPMATSLLFTGLGFFLTWFPMFMYTPENRQHDFLDRYRS